MTRNEIHDTCKFYQKYIGMFFVAELFNGKKAVGILKQVSPDGKLHIQGKYMEWGLSPQEIKSYFARPDKMKRGESNYT